MTLLRLLDTISLRKVNEDDLKERDDYGVPFSEQQHTHGSCYIFLCKCKSLDQSDPPEWPQILDIGNLKQHDAAMMRRRSLAKCLFNCKNASLITDPI